MLPAKKSQSCVQTGLTTQLCTLPLPDPSGNTRAAPKVMPSILWYWSVKSEVDVGGRTADIKASHQYFVTFCYHLTDRRRGAVWQNSNWHGNVHESIMHHWSPASGKTCTYRYSSTFAEYFWRANSGCEHSEVVDGKFEYLPYWIVLLRSFYLLFPWK